MLFCVICDSSLYGQYFWLRFLRVCSAQHGIAGISRHRFGVGLGLALKLCTSEWGGSGQTNNIGLVTANGVDGFSVFRLSNIAPVA